MTNKNEKQTLFYPNLGSSRDLWFARMSGHGLGNCFYNYFHTTVLAEKYNGTVIAPPWFSLKLGPLLRGEPSKRFYWRMFKPYPGEIFGLKKLITLLTAFHHRQNIRLDGVTEPNILPGRLHVVSSKFTFQGLHPHRDKVRARLLGIINDAVPSDHSWGKSNFIGIHIRLGDFAVATSANQISSGASNTRIPMSWYENLMRAMHKRYPGMPIRIFSDGRDSELESLIALGASVYRSGSDITDLLAMSSASILVGSNSTYSRWATFLGNMPSIWLDVKNRDEQPSDPATPILYVPFDATEPALWP